MAGGFFRATRHLWVLCVLIVVGWALGEGLGVEDPSGSTAYLMFTTLLLAVGLYGSTSDIDLREAGQDLRLLLLAITVGVVAKAGLIALVLWAALDEPAYIILAVAVAQIDPLSVAALRDSSRMSPRGKTILSVWASFDDPVTVLLTAYTAPLALDALDGSVKESDLGGMGSLSGAGVVEYLAQLGWNAVLAAVGWLLWRFLRRACGKDVARWSTAAQTSAVVLLLALVGFATGFTLMLGIAVIGLFFRPPVLMRHLGRVARGAYGTAALTLGTLLVGGIDLAAGLILGAAAYGAQIVVGAVLTRKLDRVDRISLALGQQNGVTAIILALSLEPMFPRAVGIVAPAIVTVNCLHFAANTLWARRQSDGAEIGAAPVKGPEPDAAHAGGVGPGPEGQAPSVQPQLPAADSVPPWKTQGDDADAVWWKSHTDTQRHRVHGDLALIALRLAASAVPGMSAHSPFRKFEAMEAVASDSGDTNSM